MKVRKEPFFWTDVKNFIWKSGGGSAFKFIRGANNRIFRRSISGMELDIEPVSMRPSMVSSPISIGKYSILLLFFNWSYSIMVGISCFCLIDVVG